MRVGPVAMKSKYEIQKRLARLKVMAQDRTTKRSGIPMLIAAEDALAWVLGENEKDGTWSMQAGLDEQGESQ